MAAKEAELESPLANAAGISTCKDFDLSQLLDNFADVYTEDQREARGRAAKKVQQALRIIWAFRKECADEFLRAGYEVEHCHDSNHKETLAHLISVAWFGLVRATVSLNGKGNEEESEAQASNGDAELDIQDRFVDMCGVCKTKFDEDDQFCMQCGARRSGRLRPLHGREELRYDNPAEPIRRRSFEIAAEDLMQSNSFAGLVNEGFFAGAEHIQRQADRWKSKEKAIKRVLRKHHIYGDKATPADAAQKADQHTSKALVALYYAVAYTIQSDHASSSQMDGLSVMFSQHKSNDGNSRWSLNQFEAIIAKLDLGFSKEFIHYLSVDLRITDDAGNIMKDELIEVMNDAFVRHKAEEETEKMLRPSYVAKVAENGGARKTTKLGPAKTAQDSSADNKKKPPGKNSPKQGPSDRGKGVNGERARETALRFT